MTDNTQSRKWMLTINNPADHGFTHEKIIATANLFRPRYFCMGDEIGEQGTYHTHVFIYSESPMRFSTVKNRFVTAHIEKSYGNCQENRDYIRKEGKWKDTKKSDTTVEGTFWEYGDMPTPKEENNPKMYKLIQDVKDGLTTTEIIEDTPSFAFKIRDIDVLRETYTSAEFKGKFRNLEVTYLYGASGTGKTSSIFKNHPPADICRITDYSSKSGIRFDAYHGQDVLVFEEFNSQIPIESMLNYLDIYPLSLPARYNDRTACYTKVYITSNIPLERQFVDVQRRRPETWKAFLRRIHKVYEYASDGSVYEVILHRKDDNNES